MAGLLKMDGISLQIFAKAFREQKFFRLTFPFPKSMVSWKKGSKGNCVSFHCIGTKGREKHFSVPATIEAVTLEDVSHYVIIRPLKIHFTPLTPMKRNL